MNQLLKKPRKSKPKPGRWLEALRRLKSAKLLSFDVETSGLDWKRNHIVGYVLTFGPAPQDSYYLPVRHAAGGNLLDHAGPQTATGWDGKPHPVELDLLPLLDRQSLHVFGHNLQFDLKFLWRHGARTLSGTYEDTAVNAALLDEWQGKFSLDFCSNLAGVQAKKGDAMYAHIRQTVKGVNVPEGRSSMAYFWMLRGDDPMAVEYAEGDGTTTWQLRDWQHAKLIEQELQQVHNIESRLIPVLTRMSAHGIKIDMEKLERITHETRKDIERLMAAFPSGFNPKSPQDVRAWCEKHGQTGWPLTPKRGQPSFPESWLSTHDAGKAIVEVRKYETLMNTFLTPLAERHAFNGRVHCEYHQLRGDEYGTITGRLSATDPNLQAASKRNKDTGRRHRGSFVADKGMEWVSTDYSQCEPRLLAEYSQCRVLVEGYTADPPVDAHQAVANATGLDRETGKRINQTLITGGGKGVLVSKYGVDPNRIDEIWATYFRSMPEIRILQKKAAAVMRNRGYILSLLGRRARLLHPDKDYQALNRLLQGGNADVIKTAMVRIDEYLASEGRPVQLLNNVHDAIDFQSPKSKSGKMHPALVECLRLMTDFGPDSPIQLTIPMVVDMKRGSDWAEATFGA